MEDLGEQRWRKPILRSRLRPSYRYRASRRLYNRQFDCLDATRLHRAAKYLLWKTYRNAT